LSLYVDAWDNLSTGSLPSGPDQRSTASLQEKDFRSGCGAQWQIDWSTWANQLKLDPTYGLYSSTNRFQSGFNQERMPVLTAGWAEIEIDWTGGRPPTAPSGYFGPMVGFRKEINREENLEVIPIGQGGGKVNLAFEAWVGGGPQIQQQWGMPLASIGGGTHIPEPGDIIRVRWEPQGSSQLRVRASYYDASARSWSIDVIDTTLAVSNVGGVNFNDGYHTASSITADTPFYSIRRYKVGTIDTDPSDDDD
jgi:hypothetical protein